MTETTPKIIPDYYISRAKGKQVIIHPVNERAIGAIEGILDGYTPYEVRLKTLTGEDLLFFKYAIVYIEGDFSKSATIAPKKGMK